MAKREDDYGNPTGGRKTQRERGRAPTTGRLREQTTYLGGVPYKPFRRGRARRGGIQADTQTQPFPDPPDTWTGTLPEWAIYWAHTVLGRKEFQDFQYQYTLDGAHFYDFYEFLERIAIEVQGLYWHYEFEHKAVVNDQALKVRTEALGLTLIFIDEDHALADPVFYLREALAERDHSRAAKGGTL
jgi:hypothetical protein